MGFCPGDLRACVADTSASRAQTPPSWWRPLSYVFMFTGLHSQTCSPAAVPPNVEEFFTNTNGTKCSRSRNLTTADHTAALEPTPFLFNLQFCEVFQTEGVSSCSGVEAQMDLKCCTVVLIRPDSNSLGDAFFRFWEKQPLDWATVPLRLGASWHDDHKKGASESVWCRIKAKRKKVNVPSLRTTDKWNVACCNHTPLTVEQRKQLLCC